MATPCVEVWQTSTLRRLRLGEEKRKNKQHDENIMVSPIHRAAITTMSAVDAPSINAFKQILVKVRNNGMGFFMD